MLLGTLETTDGCDIWKKKEKSPAPGVGKGINPTGQEQGRGWKCSVLSPTSS